MRCIYKVITYKHILIMSYDLKNWTLNYTVSRLMLILISPYKVLKK